MKPRPRFAENRIAQELNDILNPLGYSTIERIPVTGRRGPDLTINEAKFVVDVKSRKAIPDSYLKPKTPIGFNCGDQSHVVVPISLLPDLTSDSIIWNDKPSVQVLRYLNHMHEWTNEHLPDGVTVIVLHKANMPYGNAKFTFYHSDIRRVMSHFKKEVP